MITPGQTLENPVTGERFTFTHTAASTNGELLAFDFALRPGGAVPLPDARPDRPARDFALRPGGAVPMPHVPPIQTERFEVTSGTMRFRVGRETVIAEAGDVV